MPSAVSLMSKIGIERSISDARPTHYIMKILLFSLFSKNGVEKYELGEFEAGGYKWNSTFSLLSNDRHEFSPSWLGGLCGFPA